MQHEEPVLLPHTLDSEAQTRRPRSVAFTQPPPGIRPGWPQRPERDPRPWLSLESPAPWVRAQVQGSVRRDRARAPLGVGGRGPRRGRPHLPTRPRSRTASHLRPRAGAGASGQGQPPPPGRPLLPLVLPHRPGALLLSPGLQGLSLPSPLAGQAREPPPQRGPGQGHAPVSSPSCGSPWGGGSGPSRFPRRTRGAAPTEHQVGHAERPRRRAVPPPPELCRAAPPSLHVPPSEC